MINKIKNIIVIIKTRFEKSLAFYLISLLFALFKTILIIISLNALLDEQCVKLQRISEYRPFVLNSDNNNLVNVVVIRAGQFTHSEININHNLIKRLSLQFLLIQKSLLRSSFISKCCGILAFLRNYV